MTGAKGVREWVGEGSRPSLIASTLLGHIDLSNDVNRTSTKSKQYVFEILTYLTRDYFSGVQRHQRARPVLTIEIRVRFDLMHTANLKAMVTDKDWLERAE